MEGWVARGKKRIYCGSSIERVLPRGQNADSLFNAFYGLPGKDSIKANLHYCLPEEPIFFCIVDYVTMFLSPSLFLGKSFLSSPFLQRRKIKNGRKLIYTFVELQIKMNFFCRFKLLIKRRTIAQIFAEITFIHCYLFIFKSKNGDKKTRYFKKNFYSRNIIAIIKRAFYFSQKTISKR